MGKGVSSAREAQREREEEERTITNPKSVGEMDNSLFQQPLGLESPNAPRASLFMFRQWFRTGEELYPLLLQLVIYGFLENFQNQELTTQLAQTYSVSILEILLTFTLFLYI